MHDSASVSSWVREPDDEENTTIEANWLFQLRRERFRSRLSGKAHDYYVMHLADAVNVIALTPDKQVILVRQFRAGSRRDSLEPPGGLLEPDEDPCEAGARELLEETGYAGDHAQFLGSAWSNPSIMTSRISLVVVNNARRVAEPRLDAGEEVAIELVPAHAIARMIRDGRIDHALSVMSLLWWLGSQWPNPFAQPGPVPANSIGRIMIIIAIIALLLALGNRPSSPLAVMIELGVIALAAYFGIKASRTFRNYADKTQSISPMGAEKR